VKVPPVTWAGVNILFLKRSRALREADGYGELAALYPPDHPHHKAMIRKVRDVLFEFNRWSHPEWPADRCVPIIVDGGKSNHSGD